MKIYCPKCSYEPTSTDKWVCGLVMCGYAWNTFDTMGRCPKCQKIWRDTQCLRCHQWSGHHEWYHYEPPALVKQDQREVPEELVV